MTKHSIAVPVAPIYNEPTFKAEIVTQCLMWEYVEVISVKDDWCNIDTIDDYSGWVQSFYLSEIKFNSDEYFIINNRFLPLYSNKFLDQNILYLLSFGTKVPILDKETHTIYKVPLFLRNYGYISIENNIVYKHKSRRSIIELSKKLIGTPYLWGGKSSFGFDCSGFVQMLFRTLGIDLPRDSSSQYAMLELENIPLEKALDGDLIFFFDNNIVNHVGIIFDDNSFIHCSGEVKIESINSDSLLYNSKLANLDYKVKSIESLI
jgi:hypothetical protein